ncbi:MAG: cell wall-binding repeat-containing protein [Actinomycetota bacterium]|nr:cell wall-binding repeat-containing protein [Actinomycetota bacterium]
MVGSGEVGVTVDDVRVSSAVTIEGLPPTISTVPVSIEGNVYGGYSGAISGVTASDPDGLPVSLTSDAPDPLTLGETVVTWTVTDSELKTAEATQSVTITDLTPPSDPTTLTSSTHAVSVPSTLTTIVVGWSDDATDTVSDVTGYSFSWSLSATETPDAIIDASASVLETTSPDLSGGVWYFNLRTADAAGNWTNTLHAGPFIISRGPDIAAIPDPGPVSSSDITVTITAMSPFGVDGVYYRIDSGPPMMYMMPFVVSAPGEHLITYWAIDGLGEVSADTLDVTVDPDPPVVTDDAPAGWQTSPVTITFEADDLVSGVASIDMTWYASIPGTTTLTVAGDTAQLVIDELGLNTIWYSAVDVLGNRSAPASCGVLFDSTVPDITIDADSSWTSTPVTVTINASDTVPGLDEVLYWVGGVGPTTYTGPFQVSAEGVHAITAQASDSAGNSAWAGPGTVRIDTSKPTDPFLIDDTHIFGIASSLDQVRVGLFGATDSLSGVAGYSYSFTTDPFDLPDTMVDAASDVTSVTSAPLADGEWYVHLRTVDAVGNWTSTVHRGPYVIDTGAPSADDNAPASWVGYSFPFEINADDGPGSGIASIDVTMTPVIGPVVVQTVPGDHFEFLVGQNGITAFEYTAYDMVGNASPSAVATIGVDTFAPDTGDDVMATGWQSSDVTVTLTPSDTGSGIAATYYRIDDWPKQLYTGPFVVSDQDITDITYWSVDNVGNVEEFKQAESIYIDKSDPVIGTYRLPATGWVSGTALAGATGNDVYSYVEHIWSSINGAPYASVLGDIFTYTTSTEGTTTVAMYAEDAAGNTSNVETVTLLVDNTAPATTDDAPVSWVSGDTTVTLVATDALSGVANTYYVIDGGARQTYIGPFAVAGEGSHEIVYWSVDVAGNAEEANSAIVRIDRSGPVVTDDSTPDWQPGPVTVTLTEADAGADASTFRYAIDGGLELATAASFEVTGTGMHEITYYGIDSLGNAGPIGRATLRIDDDAPASMSDIDSAWQQGPVDVTISASDAHVGVHSINATLTDPPPGGVVPMSVMSDTMTFTVSAEGTTTVEYFATDAVGNMEIPVPEIVRIDNTAPVVSIKPTATAAIDAVTFTVGATDSLSGVDTIMLSLDGGEPQVTDTVRVDTVGDHTIVYWAIDIAGNESAHETHDVRVSPSETTYVEAAGETRYATAVAISQRSYPTGSNAVIIATGSNWPDALGGAALAGVYDAPVLLTRTDALPDAVAAEIVRLDPNHVFVLGGTSVVSEAIEAQIRGLVVPTANLERFWGADRFTTIQVIAARVVRDAGSFDGTAFVATGLSFPDALAAAPLATALERPLYLAGAEGLSASTLAAMSEAGVNDVVILGGTSAVPGAVEGQLDTAGVAHVRMAGADRYDTALKIAESGVAAGLSWDRVAITCGTDFPDALSGGVMQGHDGSVMLLTDCNMLDWRVRDVLAAQRDIIGEVRFIGGLNAVSQAVRDGVKQVLR